MSREVSARLCDQLGLSLERAFGRGPFSLASGELDEEAAIRKFRIAAADGNTHATQH